MRSKFLVGAAALAFTATAIVATAEPASAQRWHRGFGWGPGIAAGVVGGALAAATSPLWAPGYYGYDYGYPGYAYGYDDNAYGYDPGYTYAPGGYAPRYSYDQSPGYAYGQSYAGGGRDDAYCSQRYRSYDPASGTYLGFDGVRHSCP
jgi:hypothetical protein